MMQDTYTTVRSPATLIEMFLDGTANEVYNQGRLATVEQENGVALVAYGNEVLAFANGQKIDFFVGHHAQVSPTVTRYIKLIGSLLNDTETREVNVFYDAAPTLGEGTRASDSAQFIKNYVDWTTSLSKVEKDARELVRIALLRRMRELFDN